MRQSTSQLTNEIAASESMDEWSYEKIDSIDELTLAEYLNLMLEKHQTTKKEIIIHSNLDTTYGYQIFQGKKHPSRDVLLKLAFGFSLTLEETKRLLYYGNSGTLYPRVKRDAYLMYSLHRNFSVAQVNQYLFEHGEKTLDD